MAKKNSFFNNYTVDVFLFVGAIILCLVTSVVLLIMCKHTQLKSLVTSLALQQIREVDAVTKQKQISMINYIEHTCKIQWYTICMLSLSIIGIVVFMILNARILKLFRGHLFSQCSKNAIYIGCSILPTSKIL